MVVDGIWNVVSYLNNEFGFVVGMVLLFVGVDGNFGLIFGFGYGIFVNCKNLEVVFKVMGLLFGEDV